MDISAIDVSEVEYFEEQSAAEWEQISPYVAHAGSSSPAAVSALVNPIIHDAYGPKYEQGAARGFSNDPLFDYQHLLRSMQRLRPELEFVTLHDMHKLPDATGKIICSIRHDVDIDIFAAIKQAEIESELGIPSTYYVLHTAGYYGYFYDGVFYRYNCLAPLYRRFQALGHEVGLHTDPMMPFQQYKINGAEMVATETAWLRSEGINMLGSVAHNTMLVYGAENFHIFKNRNRLAGPNLRNPKYHAYFAKMTPTTKAVRHHGKWAPLQILDEQELGFTYEGNDINWCFDAPPREYASNVDSDIWGAPTKTLRELAGTIPVFRQSYLNTDEILKSVEKMPTNRYMILSVHPIYYGQRHHRDLAPIRKLHKSSTYINPRLGWETYQPQTLQACSIEHQGEQESQSLIYSNELGMLDKPFEENLQADGLKVLFLGSRNINGESVNLPNQVSSLLAEYLKLQAKKTVIIKKLAFPTMGFTRYYAWYQWLCQRWSPDIVVLGLGADEVMRSHPDMLRHFTGYHPAHTPGAYLHKQEKGVSLKAPVASYRLYHTERLTQKSPNASLVNEQSYTATQFSDLQACLGFFIRQIRAKGATPYVLLEECGESVGVWDAATPLADKCLAHLQVVKTMRKLIGDNTIPLVDPYQRFLLEASEYAAHWQGRKEWNKTGHKFAAETLFEALFASGKIVN